MERLASPDDLVATQEGANVRVRVGEHSFLFVASERARILEIYAKAVEQAERVFRPRWAAIAGPNLEARELMRLLRELTLH